VSPVLLAQPARSASSRARRAQGLGGFPNLGNWLSRWGEKYQFAIARTKVQRTHYTVLSNPKAVMVHKNKNVYCRPIRTGFLPKFSMNSTAASKSQTAIYFLSGGKPLKTILLGFVDHLNMINGSSYFTISMTHFQRLSILKEYYDTRTVESDQRKYLEPRVQNLQ